MRRHARLPDDRTGEATRVDADEAAPGGVVLIRLLCLRPREAEKTGVGWKVWVLFFLAVWAIFAYVWLF